MMVTPVTRKPRKMKTARLRGDRIKKMREIAGLSQKELGDRIGVSLRQMGRYEQGIAEPTASHLLAMSDKLNCSADYLLGRVDAPSAHVPSVTADDLEFLARFRNIPQDLRDLINRLVFGK
jgi:transcriptional regulator with XRE-family HTH domain